ncbi:MAG: pyridoxal phosphate-dependent aminotransferase family protein [Phycisphaeraceae bacterium]|nr:pyridoxal phosphate-dependent aminotransferase family protein [Phycisphaeraceae bacterium]
MHTDVHSAARDGSIERPVTRVGFGGCDYLGYSRHPAAAAALVAGATRYGVSSSASRTTTGNRPAHDALERAFAEFVGHERALLLPEGFLANLAMCQALRSIADTAVLDERSHRSLRDACAGAGLTVRTYRHLDAGHACELTRRCGGRTIVMTDGVFTADGDLAPVRSLLNGLPADALLVVDDCHALGVIGPQGRGTRAMLGTSDPRLLMTTTLAKGVGCYGGCLAGPAWVVDGARRDSSAFICTTPVPPALAEAAATMLGVLAGDDQRLERMRRNAGRLRRGLNELGIGPGEREPETPIFAVCLADGAAMRAVVDHAASEGFEIPLMSYPGGPAPCYLRLSVTSEHTIHEIDGLLGALERGMSRAAAESGDRRGPTDLPEHARPATVQAAGLS